MLGLAFEICGVASMEEEVYAGEVKRHNVCKRSRFLDTGCKQTGPAIFLNVIPMG